MPKRSFYDMKVGYLSERGNTVAQEIALRPPGVAPAGWYAFCSALTRALNAEQPLIPIIARMAGDNVRLEARVTALLGADSALVEERRAIATRQCGEDLRDAKIEISRLQFPYTSGG